MQLETAQQRINQILDGIIPKVRVIPSSAAHGGSVAEVRQGTTKVFLPIVSATLHSSQTLR